MKRDLFFLSLLPTTIPLFFYKLGQSSLTDWDEAWYADVARTIAQTGDILNLKWNGVTYLDHPPFGSWVQALVFNLFGVNEFWVRFPQALAGLVCLFLLYLLGKELFGRLVGISSAIALSSSFWFINRSRSGDLDTLLTMLFLLSIYLALKAYKNPKYFLALGITIFCLFLTKTLVPFAILPILLVIFAGKERKLASKYIIASFILILVYFLYQIITYPNFLHVYTDVGLRGIALKTNYLGHFKLTKDYLYQGMGRWFWPGVLGIMISAVLRTKRLLILFTFVLTFILPFSLSSKVQIWHLIPLHPIWILLFFGGTFSFFEKYAPSKKYLFFSLILIPSFFIYISQIRQIWYQMIDIPRYISDIAILSKEASNYPDPLFTDGDFDPTAVFYSKKQVHKIRRDELVPLFVSSTPFLLITPQWRLENTKIDPKSYEILKKDRDKVLILHVKM